MLVSVGSAASALAAPFAYVANHGDDNVAVIDTATNKVTTSVPVGQHPLGVVVDPEGAYVYVSNQDGSNGSISIITTANKVAGVPIPVGDDPTGVALKLPGTRLYVANRVDKTLSVIDTATNQVVATIGVGENPLGVAVNPAGTPVYVVNKGNDSVTVIDTITNQVVKTVPVGNNPNHVAVSPAGDRVYVTNNGGASVSVINAATLDVTGTVSIDGFPEGVAFSPDGTRAYVANSKPASLSVIDTASQTVLTTIAVGENAQDVSVRPDGTRVYVLNRGENTISVIDAATNQEIDIDGIAGNGITRIPVGVGPVALGNAFAPALQPPRFGKLALACQTAIAANARAFAKADQAQRTTCQNRILKDIASGTGSQHDEVSCALALDSGNPGSVLARARSHAQAAVVTRCTAVAVAAIDRPCNRAASSIAAATSCILDQHQARVAEMVADTFAADTSVPLTKAALACQTTIANGVARLALAEQKQLGNCFVRILKDAAKDGSLAASAAVCATSLDPNDPEATLPALRTSVRVKIAKKCAGITPAGIGNPCDPAATTIDQVVACVLGGQATRVERMLAAEFNDACPMLTSVGLGRAYPDVCTGH